MSMIESKKNGCQWQSYTQGLNLLILKSTLEILKEKHDNKTSILQNIWKWSGVCILINNSS